MKEPTGVSFQRGYNHEHLLGKCNINILRTSYISNMLSFLHSTIPCCNKYNYTVYSSRLYVLLSGHKWTYLLKSACMLKLIVQILNKHFVQLGWCENCCTWMYFVSNKLEGTKIKCSRFMWYKEHTIQSHIMYHSVTHWFSFF